VAPSVYETDGGPGPDGSVEHAELTEPFRPILGDGLVVGQSSETDRLGTAIHITWGDGRIVDGNNGGSDHETTDRRMRSVGGVKQILLVEAIRTYSNHGDRADQLRRARRWLSEDPQEPAGDRQVSVRAKPNSVIPRRVVDRLGEDVVREMIEARQAGMQVKEVAQRYGVSESSVKRWTTQGERIRPGTSIAALSDLRKP
jgi:hypothetical protein